VEVTIEKDGMKNAIIGGSIAIILGSLAILFIERIENREAQLKKIRKTALRRLMNTNLTKLIHWNLKVINIYMIHQLDR
jgi:hypothetical protein